jgi:hypothetical protein
MPHAPRCAARGPALRACLLPLATLAALTGCDPWSRLDPVGETDLDEALWSDQLVAAGDRVYVRLPHAGALLELAPDGTVHQVDLDGAAPEQVIPLPSGAEAFVFARWPICAEDDEDIVLVDECPEDSLEEGSELRLVSGHRTDGTYALAPHFNTLQFSPDGQTAVAFLDPAEGGYPEVSGIADLTEVVFLPMGGGAPLAVSTGSSPKQVLFTTEADGTNDRAVILSTSQVVVVDVATAEVLVTYPLALDVDTVIVPEQALVAGGGRYCLLAVDGGRELYRLDLINESIDIEDLEGIPALLAELQLGEGSAEVATLVGYEDIAALDVLDGLTNERVQRFSLDHPVNRTLQVGQTLIAWSTQSDVYKDVYVIDLETDEVDEQRAGNPLRSLRLSDDGRFAVGEMGPDSYGDGSAQDNLHGLFVLELGEGQPTNLALSSAPVGMALSTRGEQSFVLLLLEGDDQLYKVDLSRPSFATPVELPAPPRSLVRLADGRVAIAHASPLGLVSFYDPANDEVSSIAGFATMDMLNEPTLPRRADD